MVNRQSKKLTIAERKNLNSIRKGYYLSKKYLNEEVSDAEYGLYEPISQYSDYWDNNTCSEWDSLNKGIKYNKKSIEMVFGNIEPKKTYKSQIDQILEYLCKFISNSTLEGNNYEIYKKMVTLHKDKIKKH